MVTLMSVVFTVFMQFFMLLLPQDYSFMQISSKEPNFADEIQILLARFTIFINDSSHDLLISCNLGFFVDLVVFLNYIYDCIILFPNICKSLCGRESLSSIHFNETEETPCAPRIIQITIKCLSIRHFNLKQ